MRRQTKKVLSDSLDDYSCEAQVQIQLGNVEAAQLNARRAAHCAHLLHNTDIWMFARSHKSLRKVTMLHDCQR